MTDNNDQNSTRTKTVGYGLGPVDTVISVDDVERDAARLAATPHDWQLRARLVNAWAILPSGIRFLPLKACRPVTVK
jgi:hypothetical protein